MKCRLYLCLLVAGVAIFAVGRPATASSLIEAASMGDTEKVQILLAQGADVDARDNDGKTALMAAKRGGTAVSAAKTAAKREGYKEIVRMLKEAGAKE